MDEFTRVHVFLFGIRHHEAQFLQLLAHHGLIHEIGPQRVTKNLFHLGIESQAGILGIETNLGLFTVNHVLKLNAVERDTVDLRHVDVGATVSLRQVSDNEGNDGDTHDSYSYPRMFSDTTNNSHFV